MNNLFVFSGSDAASIWGGFNCSVQLVSNIFLFCVLFWTVTVYEGQNVALPCPAAEIDEDATIICSRGNQTVFLYRDGRPDPDGQHPSYEGRVKYELKNDSLSLNLMNVSFSDSGTYKCITKELKGPKEEVITSDICSVNLSVLVSGEFDQFRMLVVFKWLTLKMIIRPETMVIYRNNAQFFITSCICVASVCSMCMPEKDFACPSMKYLNWSIHWLF